MKGYKVRTSKIPLRRFCQTLTLHDNPELITAYRNLHAKENIWQETLDAIRLCGIHEMEIYLLNTQLFMIVELPENQDWNTTMQRMANMPKQKEWEAFVAQYQKADANASSNEKWQPMERIFHRYDAD